MLRVTDGDVTAHAGARGARELRPKEKQQGGITAAALPPAGGRLRLHDDVACNVYQKVN